LPPASEKPAKIGHNEGPPLDPGQSWRRHCWNKAHRELWKPPPVEVVRRRMARAARLGLSYQRYATILICGNTVEGILFAAGTVTGGAVGPPGRTAVEGKLAAISDCQRLLLAGGEEIRVFEGADPECRALFHGIVPVSSPDLLAQPPSKPDRDALRASLRERVLASDTVILVGKGACGPAWVAAARLGGFVTAGEFFPN
jgi:hypothetical protein